MTAPISVGLIGLGEVAQLMHLPLLADDPRFRISALTDASPSLRTSLAERYRARALPDADALIGDPDVAAVFILTPDFLHAPLLDKAIRAGKHVFIEKPAALTVGELLPLVELNKANAKIVFVGYMRRYARAFTALKAQMPPLGDIRRVRLRDIIRESQFFIDQTRPVIRPDDVPKDVIEAGRRETHRLLCSVMGDDAAADSVRAYQVLTGLSSHSFSAMRELLGPPLRVAAARQHRGENLTVIFDYGSFDAVYEAVIHDVARFDAGLEVLTYDAHYRIGYDTPYVRFLPTRLEVTRSDVERTGTQVFGPFYEDPFRIELDAFHHAVVTGEKPKTTLEDSVADLSLFAEIGQHFLRQ